MEFTLCFTHRFSRTVFAYGSLVVISIFASELTAQTTESQDRAQLLSNQPGLQPGSNVSAEGVDNGQAAESPNDSDLGEQAILKKAERYQPFTALLAVPFYYTSNAALARRGEQSDFITVPEARVTYVPRITRTLYGDISVQQDYFNYARFSELNFGSLDVRAGLDYFLPQWHNLILRGYYDYNRLTSNDGFDDFFSNHSLIFNAELPFRFGRAQQASVGVAADISLAATPDLPRRDQYDFYIGYSVSVTRAFSLDAAGRIVVRDYVLGDRVDVSEVLAFTASYRVNKYITGSFISTFAANQSNHSVFDYGVANVGGAASLAIKF